MLRKFSCVFSNNIPLGTSESIRGPQDVRPGPRLCRGSVASRGLRHRVGPALRSEPAAVAQPQGCRRTAGWVTAAGTQTCHRRVWGRQETMLYLGVGHSEPSLRAVGSMSPPGDLPRVRVPEAVLASAGRCWRL